MMFSDIFHEVSTSTKRQYMRVRNVLPSNVRVLEVVKELN